MADEKDELVRNLESSVRSLRDRLTEKYAKVWGLQVVRKRKYEEYGHFKANMMERLKQIYDKRREPDDDEPRRESEDTQDEGVDELRDLYFQYKNEKKKLKEERMPDLHSAAYRGDFEEAERLLQAGADPKVTFRTGLVEEDEFGWRLHGRATSPLAIAIWKRHLDVAKLLAMNMPDDAWDDEALEFALEFQDPERLRILVENGMVKHFHEEFRSFVSRAGRPRAFFCTMPARERLECLDLLLKAGADVNEPSNCPAILLVFDRLDNPRLVVLEDDDQDILVYNGMVKLLLAYGAADPNFFPTTSSLPYGGITRTTLLRKAVYWGFKEAVSLLLAAGSDPNQDISCPPSVIPDKTAKMLENRESCKMMVEEAKVNRPSLLKLKNHCWNVVSGLLYSSWKARSACTESKKRDDDYEMNLLKLYH